MYLLLLLNPLRSVRSVRMLPSMLKRLEPEYTLVRRVVSLRSSSVDGCPGGERRDVLAGGLRLR
jgi:hypothetical protein